MDKKDIKKIAEHISEQWANERANGSQELFYDYLPRIKKEKDGE